MRFYRPFLRGWALFVSLLLWPLLVDARTLNLEVESRGGVQRGQLRTVEIEKVSYLQLDKLIAVLDAPSVLNGKVRSIVLSLQGKNLRLTRDQQEVDLQGVKLKLSAPPKVLKGEWMVPEEFLSRVLPKIYASVTVGEPTPARQVVRSASSRPISLTDLRVRSYRNFTRVVVEASGPFSHRLDPKSNEETRVTLAGLAVRQGEAQTVNDGLVKSLRLDRTPGQATLRVAFQSSPKEVKTSTLQEPYRLVLDFYRPRESKETARPPEAQPLRVIVLDAGHGGHDPGATGPSGLQEKDVALDVTKRLARLIEGELGVKVLLTRTSDEFIALRDRTSFANSRKADLFISIHANAHRVSANEGVETYFLSAEASDNEARQVAALENGVIALEPGNPKSDSNSLKSILWDLAQTDFQEESSRAAETLLDSLTQALRIANRGVKQAGFYVLGGAAMPAVLVEIGFVTNPKEERKLAESSYREKIARAIFQGLSAYKQRYDQKMGGAQTKEDRK